MLQAQADIEFYIMKINRLETDLSITQNQLLAARLRLRTAEDYEIKYQLLLRQSQEQKEKKKIVQCYEEQKIGELIGGKLQQRDEYWSDKLAKVQKQEIEKHQKQLIKLSQQFDVFRKRHQKCGNKFDQQDILVFKNKKLQKELQILQQKINQIKGQNDRNRQAQIKQIIQTIAQKNKQKQQNQRKIYRQKIIHLQTIISNLQVELNEAKTKADPSRQKQIQRLKKQLNLQIQRSNNQLDKINLGFIQKNKQIQQLFKQKQQVQQFLFNQKRQLKELVKNLEDRLYEKQRQHQIQLINLKQRMGKIRDHEAEGLKNQIKRIEQSFQQQRRTWDGILVQKDNQIQRMKNKFEQDRQKHKDDKQKQIKKIDDLKQRLKQYEGKKQVSQNQLIMKSLKDVEGKQQKFANYQNGVTFLDRQLKKALAKVQQKGIEITKLINQLNDLRKESQNQINGLKQKLRKDKKFYGDKILQLQQQIKSSNDQIRKRQRQNKRKEKDYEAKINQNIKQNESLKYLIQEIQKDYARALQNKKAVENSYRQQRQRSMTSKSDITMIKKQKWLQLQKQKNEMQVLFKQKQQQLRIKFEVHTEKLRHQRDELKAQNQILKSQLQSDKKDDQQNKQNKQALYSEYHKKMASLNLQIALTKNIYDALIQAKSRKTKQSKISQFDQIHQNASGSQPNIEIDSTLKKSKQPPNFLNYQEYQKMGMSFNPLRK